MLPARAALCNGLSPSASCKRHTLSKPVSALHPRESWIRRKCHYRFGCNCFAPSTEAHNFWLHIMNAARYVKKLFSAKKEKKKRNQYLRWHAFKPKLTSFRNWRPEISCFCCYIQKKKKKIVLPDFSFNAWTGHVYWITSFVGKLFLVVFMPETRCSLKQRW